MNILKSAISGILALLLSISAVNAQDDDAQQDDPQSPSNKTVEQWSLFQNGGEIASVTGWLQMGYHNKSNGGLNQHPDRFNVHQLWLEFERLAVDEGEGLNLGYHMDLMYGVDASETQSFGNNAGKFDFQNGLDHGIYGWAIPQLYAEARVGDMQVTLGHFTSPLGHERVAAPDNIFYSHSLTMYNTAPRTHTGVMVNKPVGETQVFLGWTLGWDSGFDQLGSGNSGLGGFSKQVSDKVGFSYMTSFGDLGHRGVGYTHSLIADVNLGERLTYILQSDFSNVSSATDATDDFGINNYLVYQINDEWLAAGRMEWWRNAHTSNYSATAGLNWKASANLTVRPEIRFDWSPETDQDETFVGIDAILVF